MPRWAQPVCYQLPVQHGEVEEGRSKMMIPQVETPPAACQLSVWRSTSHGPVVVSRSFLPHLPLSLSLTHTHTHTHTHIDTYTLTLSHSLSLLSLRLRKLLISFRSCISLPRSCHSTGESGILGGSFRQVHCQTRKRWCISDIDFSSLGKPSNKAF